MRLYKEAIIITRITQNRHINAKKFTERAKLFAVVLIFFILILPQASGLNTFSAFAQEEAEESEIFRIRNAESGEYLSSSNETGEFFLCEFDEENASQYYRIEHTHEGKILLNSADEDAEYCLSFDIADSGEVIPKKDEIRRAESIKISDIEDGEVLISALSSNDEEYYLTTSEDDSERGVFFANDADIRSEWALEYVTPSVLSTAYFEMRMKLYSVETLALNIKPEAIRSFVRWGTDDDKTVLVSSNGTMCALSEGETTVRAYVGGTEIQCRIEVCDKAAFTWYSQTNINNSYWNGGALSKITFMRKLFASESKNNWMDEGCAISSVAMVLHNMGATYTDGFDFRSGQSGDLPADPYTVALANIGYKGFPTASGNYYADPVYTRWSTITNAFKVNGNDLTYVHKYTGSKTTIKNAILEHPEGIVVQMSKYNGETHYIVVASCVNPSETKASKLQFMVYDPLSYDGSDGDYVLFEDSISYKLGYRYSNFTSFYYWDVK